MLEGKAGLVTGAANGIGRAASLVYAREGASVVVSDLDGRREEGEETVELIRDAGSTATFVAANVTQVGDVEALVAACAGHVWIGRLRVQ